MTLGENQKIRRAYSYLASFLLSLHLALPVYLGSSFLTQFLPTDSVGWLYALASVLSLAALWNAPYLIKYFGLRRFNLLMVAVTGLTLAAIIWLKIPAVILTAFVVLQVATLVLRFNLDLYLETVTTNAATGFTRGLFLTAGNLAWVVAPVSAGLLVTGSGALNTVYFAALLVLAPFAFLIQTRLIDDYHNPHPRAKLWPTLISWWRAQGGRDLNLRRILALDFVLNIFYATMVIYSPLYLQSLGVSWQTIGLLFSIMLVPFLLLQWPLGFLADRRWGEKEVMTIGFGLIGFSTITLVLFPGPSVVLLGIILVITRIGAASTEVMKETYFFKQIGPNDSAAIAISRNMQPLAYLIAPMAASGFLHYWPLRYIFLPLGLLMFVALFYAWRLKDTK